MLLTDTVGFIRKLPHQLVEAFRSTLEETKRSDLLLHVVDAGDPDPSGQVEAVDRVVGEIGANRVRRLIALNKADLLTEVDRARATRRFPGGVLVSALEGQGLDELMEAGHDDKLRAQLATECEPDLLGEIRVVGRREAIVRAHRRPVGPARPERHAPDDGAQPPRERPPAG